MRSSQPPALTLLWMFAIVQVAPVGNCWTLLPMRIVPVSIYCVPVQVDVVGIAIVMTLVPRVVKLAAPVPVNVPDQVVLMLARPTPKVVAPAPVATIPEPESEPT